MFVKTVISGRQPPLLNRLGFESGLWHELINDFGKRFYCMAGTLESFNRYRDSPQSFFSIFTSNFQEF